MFFLFYECFYFCGVFFVLFFVVFFVVFFVGKGNFFCEKFPFPTPQPFKNLRVVGGGMFDIVRVIKLLLCKSFCVRKM